MIVPHAHVFSGASARTQDGHTVTTFKVADDTASVNMSIFDELAMRIQGGDILRLSNGCGVSVESL